MRECKAAGLITAEELQLGEATSKATVAVQKADIVRQIATGQPIVLPSFVEPHPPPAAVASDPVAAASASLVIHDALAAPSSAGATGNAVASGLFVVLTEHDASHVMPATGRHPSSLGTPPAPHSYTTLPALWPTAPYTVQVHGRVYKVRSEKATVVTLKSAVKFTCEHCGKCTGNRGSLATHVVMCNKAARALNSDVVPARDERQRTVLEFMLPAALMPPSDSSSTGNAASAADSTVGGTVGSTIASSDAANAGTTAGTAAGGSAPTSVVKGVRCVRASYSLHDKIRYCQRYETMMISRKGVSQAETARLFNIKRSTLQSWLQQLPELKKASKSRKKKSLRKPLNDFLFSEPCTNERGDDTK